MFLLGPLLPLTLQQAADPRDAFNGKLSPLTAAVLAAAALACNSAAARLGGLCMCVLQTSEDSGDKSYLRAL